MANFVANVPEGMSYVNAFRALWVNAKSNGLDPSHSEELSNAENAVSTSEKVANLFKNYPLNSEFRFYMRYEGGRKMKVHFCNFPELGSYGYDKTYGNGAAQRALDSYNLISSDQRFDTNDTYRFSEL